MTNPLGTSCHTETVGPASVHLSWRVGDSWASEEWVVLINGGPVDLTSYGWQVRAQARSSGGLVLAEWSSLTVDPGTSGRVVIGEAAVPLVPDGPDVVTSSVRLTHSPSVSKRWGPFVAIGDVEVMRRPQPDLDPSAGPVENYTIAVAQIVARQEVSR